ncbi:MAG: peptidylprolyl isomerase [Polyangiales bacterium]
MFHVQHLAALGLLGGLGACPSKPAPPPQPDVVAVTQIPAAPDAARESAPDAPAPRADAPGADVRAADVARATAPFWHEGYPSGTLPQGRVTALRALARDPSLPESATAAFVLGRRVPRAQLESVLGEIPEARLEDFVRGMMGRVPADGPAALGRLAALLDRPTPSGVTAALVQRFKLPLGGLHGLPLRWLASSQLDEQLIGAQLAASPDADSLSPALITGLHPIALSTLARSMKGRSPDVRHGFEAQALALLGERVALHPRSWANGVRTLLETADFDDAAVRLAFADQVPRLEGVRLDPPSVGAAFRCAVAVVADRVLSGERVMRCAEGSERWRSLAARAERIAAETPPREPVARLQAVLREAGGEFRVLEAVARAATHTEGAADPALLQSLARTNEPGVLAELLEGLVGIVERGARAPTPRRILLDRMLTAPVRQRLLRAPFELPEETAIEARTHALVLTRLLGEPTPVPAGVSRAIQAVVHPELGVTPDSAPAGAPVVAARLRVRTTAGSFVLSLRGDTAPQALRVTLDAARAGRYRGTLWHRVVPWFVAQGGDPRGDGYGGTDRIVRTEVSGERFARGSVGVPLGGLDSGGMQWFVMLADAPSLDARYPWIGTVTEGMSVVDRTWWRPSEVTVLTFHRGRLR